MELAKNKTQVPIKSRILVIGDIHGSAKALGQVLDRAMVNEKDTIIQLGDVADGWSETSECVDMLLEMQKTCECVFLRGNHDVWVYDWLKWGDRPMMWTEQGGRATLDSYIKSGMFTYNEHQNFWFDQKDWYIDDQNRLFIHAGWDYMTGSIHWDDDLSPLELFERQASFPVNAGTIAKECHWDRNLLRGAASAFGRKNNPKGRFKPLETFKEVYIGHTATKDYLPHQYGNLYNLDTGAGWHGVLTIMDIDTKEYWQSDFSKDLYPDEKGRG